MSNTHQRRFGEDQLTPDEVRYTLDAVDLRAQRMSPVGMPDAIRGKLRAFLDRTGEPLASQSTEASGSLPPDRLTDLEHEATRAAFHLREATGLIDTDDVVAWKHVQMAYDRLRLADREPEDRPKQSFACSIFGCGGRFEGHVGDTPICAGTRPGAVWHQPRPMDPTDREPE